MTRSTWRWCGDVGGRSKSGVAEVADHGHDIAMAKLSPVDRERLDVVHHLAGRLLAGVKSTPLTGKDLERMQLIEQAVSCFEAARII